MPRTYCVFDYETQCEVEYVHEADYAARIAERDRLRDLLAKAYFHLRYWTVEDPINPEHKEFQEKTVALLREIANYERKA